MIPSQNVMSVITPEFLCKPSTKYFCSDDKDGVEYAALVLLSAKIDSIVPQFGYDRQFKATADKSSFFYLVTMSYDEITCKNAGNGVVRYVKANSGKRYNMTFGVCSSFVHIQCFAS